MEGKYKYLKNLEELFQFLLPYLNNLGIKIKLDENSIFRKTPDGRK